MISDVGGPRVCSAYDVMCALVVDGFIMCVCIFVLQHMQRFMCGVCHVCACVCGASQVCTCIHIVNMYIHISRYIHIYMYII